MKRDLSKMTCIEDLRLVAKRKMPRMFYDYIDSGSWTETTYRENTSDFKDIRFRQKVLVNMEGRSLETKMIGQDVKMPVAIAPTGFTGMAHADSKVLPLSRFPVGSSAIIICGFFTMALAMETR